MHAQYLSTKGGRADRNTRDEPPETEWWIGPLPSGTSPPQTGYHKCYLADTFSNFYTASSATAHLEWEEGVNNA